MDPLTVLAIGLGVADKALAMHLAVWEAMTPEQRQSEIARWLKFVAVVERTSDDITKGVQSLIAAMTQPKDE